MLEGPLCVLPWIHTQIDTTGWTKVCCVSGCGEEQPPVVGTIRESSVFEIFHSERMTSIREQMASGVWPEECSFCQRMEAVGVRSFRNKENAKYSSYLRSLAENPAAFPPSIRYVDIRISNECNFRCRSCSGYASSRWFEDHNAIYPSMRLDSTPIGIEDVASFWTDFYDRIVPNLEEIHLSGGEPLINGRHYEIIEELLRRGKRNVRLYYDTNLSTLRFKRWDALALWKQFPDVFLSVSLDGVGRRGEYIRSGLSYGRWVENMQRVLVEVPHVKRAMHFVVSILNVLDFREHYREIVDTGLVPPEEISFTLLEWPPYLSVQSMPAELKKVARDRLLAMSGELFVDESCRRFISGLVRFMDEEDLFDAHGADFARKTRILDERRGECAEELFPELGSMLRP